MPRETRLIIPVMITFQVNGQEGVSDGMLSMVVHRMNVFQGKRKKVNSGFHYSFSLIPHHREPALSRWQKLLQASLFWSHFHLS